jgi:hypothetical protein
LAKIIEAKIVIPLKTGAIAEISKIDKLLLEIEDELVERLGVAVNVKSEVICRLADVRQLRAATRRVSGAMMKPRVGPSRR